MSKKRKTLDEQILQVVKERGLTGYGLAKMSGVSQTIICRFINRERSPTLRTANKIVAALGLVLVPEDEVKRKK